MSDGTSAKNNTGQRMLLQLLDTAKTKQSSPAILADGIASVVGSLVLAMADALLCDGIGSCGTAFCRASDSDVYAHVLRWIF